METDKDPSTTVSHKKIVLKKHFEATSSLVRSLPRDWISKFIEKEQAMVGKRNEKGFLSSLGK